MNIISLKLNDQLPKIIQGITENFHSLYFSLIKFQTMYQGFRPFEQNSRKCFCIYVKITLNGAFFQ